MPTAVIPERIVNSTDVRAKRDVEVSFSADGRKVWVNIDGVCRSVCSCACFRAGGRSNKLPGLPIVKKKTD